MEIVSHPSELRKVAEVGEKSRKTNLFFFPRTNKGQGTRLIISDVLEPPYALSKSLHFSLKQCQLLSEVYA